MGGALGQHTVPAHGQAQVRRDTSHQPPAIRLSSVILSHCDDISIEALRALRMFSCHFLEPAGEEPCSCLRLSQRSDEAWPSLSSGTLAPALTAVGSPQEAKDRQLPGFPHPALSAGVTKADKTLR